MPAVIHCWLMFTVMVNVSVSVRGPIGGGVLSVTRYVNVTALCAVVGAVPLSVRVDALKESHDGRPVRV